MCSVCADHVQSVCRVSAEHVQRVCRACAKHVQSRVSAGPVLGERWVSAARKPQIELLRAFLIVRDGGLCCNWA